MWQGITNDERAAIILLQKENVAVPRIAERYNCSKRTVLKIGPDMSKLASKPGWVDQADPGRYQPEKTAICYVCVRIIVLSQLPNSVTKWCANLGRSVNDHNQKTPT